MSMFRNLLNCIISPQPIYLQYLTCSGHEYINTGVIFEYPQSLSIEVKVTAPVLSGIENGICGALTQQSTSSSLKNTSGFAIGTYNTGRYANYQYGENWKSNGFFAFSSNETLTWNSVAGGCALYKNNTLLYTNTYPMYYDNAPFYIMSNASRGSGVSTLQGDFYYLRVTENGQVTHDYRPCLSQESGHINEVCVFDKITRQYLYNNGTGSFIAGPFV